MKVQLNLNTLVTLGAGGSGRSEEVAVMERFQQESM